MPTAERAFTQTGHSRYVDSLLWVKIEKRLEKDPSPDSYDFIAELVDANTEDNADARYHLYQYIFDELGDRFNSRASIYVAEKLVQTARQLKDTLNEAHAYVQLAYQYDAIGRYELLNINIDKAIRLYEKMGKKEDILLLKLNFVDRKSHTGDSLRIYTELESLLKEIIRNGDKGLANKGYINSLRIAISDSNLFYIKKYTAALTNFMESNPGFSRKYTDLIYVNLGKAWAAYYENDLADADRYFRQALHYCEVAPSRWLEVNTLQCLSMLALKQGNLPLAKTYLDKAGLKATAMNSDDLLVMNYELKARVAMAAGDYKAALTYLEKKTAHQKSFDDRSKGFSFEKYYLQKEKEQLEIEKSNNDLALSLKQAQLVRSLIITFFIIIIAVFFIWTTIRQRREKIVLKKSNELILEQSLALQKLDTAKSNFFANVSHELRTPLALIAGPINTVISQRLLPKPYEKLMQAASQSARHLELMIRDILDLRKMEMGKMTINAEPTAAAAYYNTHVQQFESLATDRQIRFEYHVDIDPSLVCELDREKNRQILYNLLSNAFKFTPAGGSVSVKLWTQANELKLSVADTGCGIHPDDMPHIFDRFFRSERKATKTVSGTGIGLNICQEFSQLMNATIVADSSPGKGTRFVYSLPVIKTTSKGRAILAGDDLDAYMFAIETAIKNEEQVTTKDDHKPVVLVVEDNLMLQQYIRMILSHSYHVRSAVNGEEALQILREMKDGSTVEILISDVMMPVMDGFELLEAVRSSDQTRHIPVIMLTARADAGDKIKALRLGVDDYLSKPFAEEELLARIANLLHNRKIRLESVPEPGIGSPQPTVSPTIKGADLEWLTRFEQYIAGNFENENLSVPDMSSDFAMSSSTLLRQLKRLTGLSPIQYVQEMRLNQARQLIENQEYKTVAEISAKVGYNDIRTFSRNFKARFGKSPSELL